MKAFQASILFSIVAIAFAACQGNSYKIKGTAEGLSDGDTLFVTHDMDTGVPSDTLIVQDGRFTLSGATDSVELCMVYSMDRNEVNAAFFMEPGSITVHLSDKPGASRVSGTLCNDEWQTLNDSVIVIGKEINRIAEHIYGNNLPMEEQEKGMEQIEKLNERFAALVVKTTEENIDNEFGYFLLTYYPEELIDNISRAKLIQQLPSEMRARPLIKQMEKVVGKALKTAEGETIKDFKQKSPDGEEVSLLEEVKKNKVTIIDFWASWCMPCRQEMPKMVKLYEKYQPKGLGIIGISLDSDHDAWVNAIKSLGINWQQMSDLQGRGNEIAVYFMVPSIPHTVVVDKNGKILRRGLRTKQIDELLQGLLK